MNHNNIGKWIAFVALFPKRATSYIEKITEKEKAKSGLVCLLGNRDLAEDLAKKYSADQIEDLCNWISQGFELSEAIKLIEIQRGW